MIDDGVLRDPAPEVALGLHMWNEVPVGAVALDRWADDGGGRRFYDRVSPGAAGMAGFRTRPPIRSWPPARSCWRCKPSSAAMSNRWMCGRLGDGVQSGELVQCDPAVGAAARHDSRLQYRRDPLVGTAYPGHRRSAGCRVGMHAPRCRSSSSHCLSSIRRRSTRACARFLRPWLRMCASLTITKRWRRRICRIS